ncbi:twin-arginine translocase subunit TatC [Cocleimonas sp. KMM 6892]|uniref:twin-arginine translocase subunit TatC n=1 Tax=unclassified Cocleimonas TaxID=2639732 RepID=UPI002DBF180B|nr:MULTISPECIES: twin-arginine translocase subunit TatC [unclassified Cocleimonas]MEB8430900.1 twin-arginine translocase subunit TatC [Cocleimonas sp. KMM 6892]MEC4714328.1 twin-arginine translocase subunit TatC [Cocleimonas sp. KMM 6895]MEC4743659.1 twin-arginine translocase subunit TatC [Cocleimonas sp. KMM 6896]
MSDSKTSASELPATATGGFLSHLIEMRDRLLRAVIVIFVAFVCLFPFAKNIYNWLAAPLVDQGQEMLIIGPVAPFLIPMKLTLMVAFLIALPYLFYQLWSFVAPGLYKHEKRLIYPLIASSIFLFYLGIAFVYYILLPMMFKIIPQFAPEVAVFSPDIAQYLDFTIMMFMAFGFGFEMPIATILLISTGMTTAEDLKKKRPYVIVGAFVVGMLLTPPDVISQIMLAIPMWLLFELGIIFSGFFKTRIEEASEAKDNINAEKEAAEKTAASAAAGTAAISADKLWEDDDNYYEEFDEDDSDNTIHNDENNETGLNEYTDDDAFDMSSPSDAVDESKETDNKDNEDSLSEGSGEISESEEAEKFYGTDVVEDFEELTDDEMEAELDRIEADEDNITDQSSDETNDDKTEDNSDTDIDDTAKDDTKENAPTKKDEDSKD